MKITIRTRHLELTSELREQLHRRMLFALGRLAPAIRAVDVTMVDVNGPKGGDDKHCRIRVRGHAMGTIVVEHLGADTLATLAVAADRTEQAVVRALARRRMFAPALAT